MQEANKTVVRRYIEEVLNEDRLELIEELFAPALHEAATLRAASCRATFPDMLEETGTLITEGDVVAALGVPRHTTQGVLQHPADRTPRHVPGALDVLPGGGEDCRRCRYTGSPERRRAAWGITRAAHLTAPWREKHLPVDDAVKDC